MFKKILNMFKKNNPKDILELDNFVDRGLLTKEEVLRIKKDRAIDEWQKETQDLKKKR
jgi:hypothetical protein